MKKILATLLAFVLLSATAFPAQAALPDPPISPQYSHIKSIDAELSINESSGIASCSSVCYSLTNNEVRIEYKLQRYMGSYWGTIKTWTSSGSRVASLSQLWAVSSGYTYRAHVTCWVYDSAGNMLETGSITRTYSYPSN